MKILTFDIEIRNKILGKGETEDPFHTYCGGWGDYPGMGISFLGAHSDWDDRLNFFDENNLPGFLELVEEADFITGYNILGFDIPLLKATLKRLGQKPLPDTAGKVYDIFYDVRKNKVGYPWKLDDVASATLGFTKSGDGAKAPELWQAGLYAELINYLAQDVRVEAALFKHVYKHGWVSNGNTQINLTEIANLPGRI